MALVNPQVSVINLSRRGLNSPVMRHRVAFWTEESKSQHYSAFRRQIKDSRIKVV